MKPNTDWTDALRDRLRDAELAPDPKSWERLERALATPVVPLWRRVVPRIVAAAAVVAVLVTADALLFPDTDGLADPVALPELAREEADAEPAAGGEELPEAPFRKTAADPASGTRLAALSSVGRRGGSHAAQIPNAAAHKLASERTQPSTSAAAVSETASETVSEAASDTSASANSSAATFSAASDAARCERPAAARTAYAGPDGAYDDDGDLAPARGTRRTGVTLFGGSGLSGQNALASPDQRVLASEMPIQLLRPDAALPFGPLFGYEQAEFRHRLPLSFGLWVRRDVGRRFSVASGAVYTLLRSDVRLSPGADYESQRLHMIGVPLRAEWRALDRSRVRLYVGAGAMAEWCVAARLAGERVEERGVQWSLSAAAGAEYRLGGRVGLYFEPELSYYLTETTLHTARTEHPLSLSLRAGVRLTF